MNKLFSKNITFKIERIIEQNITTSILEKLTDKVNNLFNEYQIGEAQKNGNK